MLPTWLGRKLAEDFQIACRPRRNELEELPDVSRERDRLEHYEFAGRNLAAGEARGELCCVKAHAAERRQVPLFLMGVLEPLLNAAAWVP
jgi:hypothetical protein